MRVSNHAVLAGLFLLVTLPASARERPAAPQVVVSANLKELVFDWEPVPDAYTYWLLEKTSDRTYYKTIGERLSVRQTRVALPIAVHLQNWSKNQALEQSRYRVTACNPEGCTPSVELNPENLMLDAIGYFKASNTGANDAFGADVALSADGQTLVVAAEGEDGGASGVNGNQASNSASRSGAVYVYRRVNGVWVHDAYLKAGVNQAEQHFGTAFPAGPRALAISGDGTWLAVGAPGQDTSQTDAGVVYLFTRGANGWSLAATLQAPTAQAGDFFGASVDLSRDGRTLKVNSRLPLASNGESVGRTHIYLRPQNTWQRSVTLAPYYAGDRCDAVRMSTDGRTLVSSCTPASGSRHVVTQRLVGTAWGYSAEVPVNRLVTHRQLAVNHEGTLLAVADGDIITLYRWEDSAWLREVGILAPSSFSGDGVSPGWGRSIAFDPDGRYLAIGDPTNTAGGAGVSSTVYSGTEAHGGVYLYERTPWEPNWTMRTWVKAPNPGAGDSFGASVALGDGGRTLAVGATAEDGGSTGIDGNRASNSTAQAGAVYLY